MKLETKNVKVGYQEAAEQWQKIFKQKNENIEELFQSIEIETNKADVLIESCKVWIKLIEINQFTQKELKTHFETNLN